MRRAHLKVVRAFGAAVLGTVLAGSPLAAQTITERQADEILRELRAIRQLLEQLTASRAQPSERAADRTVRIPELSGYLLGRVDAPVTIVEFTDLQCPECMRFATETFDRLREAYIETGRVRFITRDLPHPDEHPLAERAARAARCAGEQDRFWELWYALGTHADELSPTFIAEQAQQVGLDTLTFVDCVESDRFRDAIQADVDEAHALGIDRTPTFIIGRTSDHGLEGMRIDGAQPFAIFDARIKALLLSPN